MSSNLITELTEISIAWLEVGIEPSLTHCKATANKGVLGWPCFCAFLFPNAIQSDWSTSTAGLYRYKSNVLFDGFCSAAAISGIRFPVGKILSDL